MDVEKQAGDWPLSLANVDFSVDDRKEVVEFVTNTKYPHGGNEAEKYRSELQGMPFHSLVGLLSRAAELKVAADEKQKKQRNLIAEIERREQALFFNKSRAMADFDHWSRLAYWSIDAGVALLLGREPTIVTWDAVRLELPHDFAVQFRKLRDLAQSYVGRQLTDPIHPSVFLRWAQRFDLEIPPKLLEKVERYNGEVRDWRDAYDKKEQEAASWKAGCEELQKTAEAALAQARQFSDLCRVYKERIDVLEARLGNADLTIKPVAAVEVEVIPETHKYRQVAQEERILDWLRMTYGDPTQLPKKEPGKPWVRAECRKVMKSEHKDLFSSTAVVEKAWDRLLEKGEISEGRS